VILERKQIRQILAGAKREHRLPAGPDDPIPDSLLDTVHPLQATASSKSMGRVHIVGLHHQAIADMTADDAKAEGHRNLPEFRAWWAEYAGPEATHCWSLDLVVDLSEHGRFLHRQSERGYTTDPHLAMPREPEAVEIGELAPFWADLARARLDAAKGSPSTKTRAQRLAELENEARTRGLDTRRLDASIDRRIAAYENLIRGKRETA